MAITKIPTELIDTTSHMDFLDGKNFALARLMIYNFIMMAHIAILLVQLVVYTLVQVILSK